MTLVMDTASIAPRDRIEAVLAAVGQASQAPRFRFQGGAEEMHFRIEVHTLGPLTVTRTTSTGLRLDLTPKLLDSAAPAAVALMLHEQAPARFEQYGRQVQAGPGSVLVNDLTSPYTFSWSGLGRSSSVVVAMDQLALPVDTVRRAAAADLRGSAFLNVVLNHLRYVLTNIDAIAADPRADAVGRMTTELLRGLMVDAAQKGRAAGTERDAAILAGAQAYVRRHLDDRNLAAAQIAADQHVSLRRLYEAFSSSGLSLAEWTMTQRLEGARSDLADPFLGDRTIARTAHRWGFVDAAHFSRRFRAAYGVSPRDWRRLHAGSPAAPKV